MQNLAVLPLDNIDARPTDRPGAIETRAKSAPKSVLHYPLAGRKIGGNMVCVVVLTNNVIITIKKDT